MSSSLVRHILQLVCSHPPVAGNWSACGEAEQEYLSQLFEFMQGLLGQLCRPGEVEKEEGCDVHEATGCLQDLANAFVLPAVSACS